MSLRLYMNLNFTEELCVVTMRNDAKFEEELTFCHFKIDMRSLMNFDKFWPIHPKVSKIFTLMGSFWAKHKLLELKKYRGVIFRNTEERRKIWRGTDLLFQVWHEEFDEFWPKHSKVSKSFILMGSFSAKFMLFELKKDRWDILHDNEDWCKTWRGIDLSFQNWHEEFNKFWPGALEIRKSQKVAL